MIDDPINNIANQGYLDDAYANQRDYGDFTLGSLMYAIAMENPLSKYLIRPTFRFTGSVLNFILPSFITSLPGKAWTKVWGTYPSQDFVTLLEERVVISENSPLVFCQEYFTNAIEQCFSDS